MSELAGIYLYVFPIVMVSAIAEGLWLSHRKPGSYDWKAWACSLVDLVIRRVVQMIPYGLAAPVLALAWDYRLFTLKPDSVGTVLLLFVGLEFFYYWYHRTSHTVRWFWATHAVHHSPNQLTLATAYRLGWTGKLTGTTVFFAPLVLLGFSPQIVLTALVLNLLYQFWLHCEWIPKLGWLEYVFNTPSHHRVHHARNPDYLDANYGGVLIVFDRLFGTYIEERADLPCDYGLVSRVESYNPVYIAFHAWIDLAHDLGSARSPSEVLHYLFGAPGWRPDGQGLTTAELRKRGTLAHAA
jgi:sterol desaturase/sphingolipid hydroxylase (fatty acid hydroxylase superfamily)